MAEYSPNPNAELMTVIALLNVENDPHVVADTLLSAEGQDLRKNTTVWMPGLGQMSSSLGTKEDPWYIVRLARKTFFLPNYSGVLAFAGDCSAAFDFWREFKARILTLGAYQSDLLVDRSMIERAINHSNRREHFSLLGLIRNSQGRWDVFTHNQHTVIETQHFGTCYLSGSGVPLLASKLRQQDKREQPIKPNVIRRIGPTENLAEGISADLLYSESGAKTGMKNTSAYACGGFYEWYRVLERGVKTSPARLDVYIEDVGGKLIVTRVYLVESLQLKETQVDPIPATTYSVMVMTVVGDATELTVHKDGTSSLPAPAPFAVLLEPAFELYEEAGSDGRLSGPATADVLEKFFGDPVEVNRIRLMCMHNGLASTRSVSRLDWEQETLATLTYENNRLCVGLSAELITAAMQTLQGLRLKS